MKKLFLLLFITFSTVFAFIVSPTILNSMRVYIKINTSGLTYAKRIQGSLDFGPLCNAINENASLGKIQEIITQNKNLVNEVTEGGHTPLGSAISRSNVNVVRLLLAAGANPNLIIVNNNQEQGTFLHEALRSNSLEIVKLLVLYGADVHYNSPANIPFYNRPKGTPMHFLVETVIEKMLLLDRIEEACKQNCVDAILRITEVNKEIQLSIDIIKFLVSEKHVSTNTAERWHVLVEKLNAKRFDLMGYLNN